MGHEFPLEVNWNSTRIDILTVYGLSLLLVVGVIACCFLSKRWAAKQPTVSVWAWALAMVGAPMAVYLLSARLDPNTRTAAEPFLASYVVVFWLAGLSGMLTTHQRLKQQNNHSSFEFIVACFFVFGFFFLTIPACVDSLEAARRSQCKYNLKQIGVALLNFHDVLGHCPASAKGEPPVSWRVHALPYLDNVDLFETYDQTLTWDSDENDEIAKQRINALNCPSAKTMQDDRDRWFTHYAMVTGEGTMGGNRSQRSFDQFSDGVSNTLAVVEAAGLNIVWTEPRDSHVADEKLGVNLTGPTARTSPALISAWHRGGGHAAFADGSVHFLSHDIDPTVLKALTTIDGGDSVEGWESW